MRAGREDGLSQVYDVEANPLLYQDEYIVTQDKCFIGCNAPDAPFPVTEVQLFLTNWRLVALGEKEPLVHVDTVMEYGQQHYRVRPEGEQFACSFLEVYLDEVREFKKSLLGELKLRLNVGTVEISDLPKPFRVELIKALDWYLTPNR
jgi:hypothetical protein